MNQIELKWNHFGATRHIPLEAAENFGTFLAKMAEMENVSAFSYEDCDGDKMVVENEQSFCKMVEYFRTLPANKKLRIQTYAKEKQRFEEQLPNEDSVSSTTGSSIDDQEFDTSTENDGNGQSGGYGNSMDDGNQNEKIINELKEMIAKIEGGMAKLEQLPNSSNSNELNQLKVRYEELLPPTKRILAEFPANPNAEFELVGFWVINRKKLVQLVKDIRAILAKTNDKFSAFVDVKVAKSERENVRIADLNVDEGENENGALPMIADISVDGNGSKNGNIVICGINQRCFTKVRRANEANKHLNGNNSKWWNFKK